MLNIDHLIDMYKIFNPSEGEHKLSRYVKKRLKRMGITHTTDKYGQVYRFNPGKPLVCAHMDSVSHKPVTWVKRQGDTILGSGNIGADDKNGIWIALNILSQNPDISFIFSCQEERGGVIDRLPLADLDSPYGLIFDRKGSRDIIGYNNDYCELDLEDDIARIGLGFGYKPATGVFSDCDTLSTYVPCVNLSCGYYNAHTEREFTVVSDLVRALKFGLALIKDMPKDTTYNISAGSKWEHWYRKYDQYYDEEKRCPNCWSLVHQKDYCPKCGIFVDDQGDYYEEEGDDRCQFCGEPYDSPNYCLECEEATDRKSTRLNSSHNSESRMPSSA
jgi:hypothetical protein